MSAPTSLLDRINRVINVPEFEQSLEQDGLNVCDFQLEWSEYDDFEALPASFRRAILAGEAAL
jgi:hypothetical protein